MNLAGIDLRIRTPAKIAVFILLLWLVNCVGMAGVVTIFTRDFAVIVPEGVKAGTVLLAFETFTLALLAAFDWATK